MAAPPVLRRARLALVLLLGAVTPAFADDLHPELDASFTGTAPAALARASREAADDPAIRRLVRVQSRDERYGVPSFVWAHRRGAPADAAAAARVRAGRTPDVAARSHLSALLPLYRLDRADLAALRLRHVHDTGRGAVIARYGQIVDGVEVFRDEVKIAMDPALELVSISGHVASQRSAPAPRSQAFKLDAPRAVGLALQDFGGLAAAPAVVGETNARRDGYEGFEVPAIMRDRTDGLAVAGGLRAKPVWFRLPGGLEPGFYVEVIGETAAYSYVVSADDGRLLFRHSIMQDIAYSYRLWAHTTSPYMPMDGPQGDAPSPHPTGTPNFHHPTLIAPNLVTLQNSPFSMNDPWLHVGALETNGNNVNAYADIVSPDGFNAGDVYAQITSPTAFDHVYDTNLAPGTNNTQRMAAVTSLFFVNNFLHDWFYDSGFTEAAGNAQAENYGRGGIEADALHAQAQDHSGFNNANMSTPADGGTPRMQMYVFTSSAANLQVHSPGAIAGTYAVGTAGFGPQSFTLAGTVVAATDASAPATDVCTAVNNPGTVSGNIALIDRGTCSFVTKVQFAQDAGAIGVIIVDNVSATNPPNLGGTSGTITIPTLSVTQAVGNSIRAQLGSGVSVTMTRQPQLSRDGTLDNQIVAHEWGHYISNRLVGNSAGLTNTQGRGMGEGWGDFHSMLITVRAADAGPNFSGIYNVGAYALMGSSVPTNAYYFGIRRYPYSTDLSKNPLTFRHISNGQAHPPGPPINGDPTGVNNAQVHNTGEVWCSMLWECYAALLNDTGRLTFDQANRRMRDYLVAGYMLTPNAPTFVEARDAILAAAAANDLADHALMAQAFAKRGLGTGAIAPDRNSTTNVGAVESFVVGGDAAIVSLTLTDDIHSCDDDSYLDNGESATLWVEVANTGGTSLSNTDITVTSPDAAVSFPAGNVVPVGNTTPFQTVVLPVRVDLTGAAPQSVIRLDVGVDDPSLYVPGPRTASLHDYVEVDEVTSISDGAEAHATTWTATAGAGSVGGPWRRVQTLPTNHEYFLEDPAAVADLRFESPPITASPTDPLVLTFQHRFSFEADVTNAYDGGVLEVSTDGGASWADVGASVTPGYTGTLFSGSSNPLGGRPAWTRTSAGYPAMTSATANFGTTYASQTVRFRFRMAADVSVGGPGWWVDDVLVTGAVGDPFITTGPETGNCTPLAVEDEAPAALALAVAGQHPTPAPARLRFALPAGGRATVTVHDLAGRRVATLADGEFSAGWHSVAFARTEAGAAPNAGIYFVRLNAAEGSRVLRLAMLR